jgi:hypothetical protein
VTPPSVVAVAEMVVVAEAIEPVAEVAEDAEDAVDRVRPWSSPIVRTVRLEAQVEAIREAGAPKAAPEAALEEAGTWGPGFTRMYPPDYLLAMLTCRLPLIQPRWSNSRTGLSRHENRE